MTIRDMALLARTCKAVKAYIEPRLCQKISTRMRTPQIAEGLVNLLQNIPDIIPFIEVLVLSECHPSHLAVC